jgi:hypothetical protein
MPLSSLLVPLSIFVVQDTSAQVDSARARLTALPVGSYSEVTGIQYGATALVSFRTAPDSATRASSASAYAARTTRDHAKAYAQLDRWSPGNAIHLRIRGEYISYPLPFFGIGPHAPGQAEEWYSSGVTTGHLFVERKLDRTVFAHLGIRYVRSRMRVTEPDRLLSSGQVPGSSGSAVTIGQAGLVVDSRGYLAWPRAGTYARALVSLAPEGDDGLGFGRVTIDARRYAALGSHVLAFQMQYDGVSGTVPFDLLPMIGADTAMRGYPRGRYRDRHAFTAQAEFRSASWRRAGMVAFAGAGRVASSLGDIAGGPWFPTAGVGLRAILVPRDHTVARLDVAVGRGTFGVSVGIGEAF